MSWLGYLQEIYKKFNLYILLLSVAVSGTVFLLFLNDGAKKDIEVIAYLLISFSLSYVVIALLWLCIKGLYIAYNRALTRKEDKAYYREKEELEKQEIIGKFSSLWNNEKSKEQIITLYNLPSLYYRNQRNIPSHMRWSMDVFGIRLQNGTYLIGMEELTSDCSLVTFEPFFYDLVDKKIKLNK